MSASRPCSASRLLSSSRNSSASAAPSSESDSSSASADRAAARYSGVASSSTRGGSPKPEPSGICRARYWHSESMVRTRRRCGLSSRFQPCASACCSAAPASSPGLPLPGLGGLRPARAGQRLQDASAHFRGRLAREGDGDDLFRVVRRRQQAQEALRQQAGLARAGRRLHDEGALRIERRLPLRVVGGCAPGLSHPAAPRLRRRPGRHRRRRRVRGCGTGRPVRSSCSCRWPGRSLDRPRPPRREGRAQTFEHGAPILQHPRPVVRGVFQLALAVGRQARQHALAAHHAAESGPCRRESAQRPPPPRSRQPSSRLRRHCAATP